MGAATVHPLGTRPLICLPDRELEAWNGLDQQHQAEVSAICECLKRSADLGALFDLEFTHPLGEKGSAYRLEVVERCHALVREPMTRAEGDFGWDSTDRAGHGRHNDPPKYRHGIATRDDQHRPPLILCLCPPDLSLGRRDGHQGSSAIMRVDDSSAHPTSASLCGCDR